MSLWTTFSSPAGRILERLVCKGNPHPAQPAMAIAVARFRRTLIRRVTGRPNIRGLAMAGARLRPDFGIGSCNWPRYIHGLQGFREMSPANNPSDAAIPMPDNMRRRSIGFLNWAHFLDHYVILIFPTVVIGLEAVYGRSYGDLLVLSTAAFSAFGLFALPAGWLADNWSRRNMIAIYFFGTGICCVLVGLSDSFETLAIALFGVGLFAAVYHPVGTPMVVDAAVQRGRTMAFNGICGNIGVSIASGSTALIASWLGWRYTFFIPAIFFFLAGIAYLKFVPDDGGRRVVQAPDQDVALSKPLTIAVVVMFLLLAFWVGLVF